MARTIRCIVSFSRKAENLKDLNPIPTWGKQKEVFDPRFMKRPIEYPVPTHKCEGIPVVNVSRSEFDKLANTLDDLSPKLKAKVQRFSCSDWGAGFGFLAKFGKSEIVIDTQGYDYPRYKSLCKRVRK
jgi:hypothetical protein